jgi:hypothetical protein
MCVYIRERRRRGRKIVGEMALLTKRWPQKYGTEKKKKGKRGGTFSSYGRRV